MFHHLVTAPRATGLSAEAWFTQNGSYLEDLYETGANPERIERFVRTVRLSRYVGILRWFLDGEALADVVCDTTDVRRDAIPYAQVLAIIFFNDAQAQAAPSYVSDLLPPGVVF